MHPYNKEHMVFIITESVLFILAHLGFEINKNNLDHRISFIDLGMDSLGLIELTEILSSELKIDLEVETVLENICIEDLANYLASFVVSNRQAASNG